MTPMQKALSLARQALGSTSPNPAVGAVVVKDEAVIGEGYTLPPGQEHAEIIALNQADSGANGATLYTTLEPCCHQGRTPPCTKAIIAAGVQKVHVAAIDPNPAVSGRGCAELEAAGIEVVREECDTAAELYEAFAKHVKTGQPFVTAKFAMSLDGKIATHSGDSRWVSGPEARKAVQQMRRECDAVLVGVNTVLADDPQLTARDEEASPLKNQPLRVILDSHGRTPPGARMFGEPGTTIIVTTPDVPRQRLEGLNGAGAQIWQTKADAEGRVQPQAVLDELGKQNVVSLLLEGGGMVLGSFFDTGLVDKVYVFIAPMIIGGGQAPSPVAGQGVSKIIDAWQLERTQLHHCGPDWLIVGYPVRRS